VKILIFSRLLARREVIIMAIRKYEKSKAYKAYTNIVNNI
jgi:hypothetical protein